MTYFEDTAGTKAWKMLTVNAGSTLEDYAGYGTQAPNLLQRDGYTFAGWATEPNIVADSYRTKSGALNPALEGKLVDFEEPMYEDVDAYLTGHEPPRGGRADRARAQGRARSHRHPQGR